MSSEMTDAERPPTDLFLLSRLKTKVAQAIVWTVGCVGENRRFARLDMTQ